MMDGEDREIRITGVEKEGIKGAAEKKDCWSVPFKLSAKPDQSWERNFYEVQQKDRSAMKRKARVVGDYINVEVFCVDDLQKVLDVIKTEVTETNVLCEADYQKKIKIRQEVETLQQKQRDAILKLKNDSDKLIF